MQREENTFEDEQNAKQWIESVENEKDSYRDKAIYPLLSKWISENNLNLIVEIGSGQGICSSKINLRNSEYIGIEPSEFLVKRANELYTKENIKFIIGNAYNLPIQDKSIDGVFSVMVLFHLENLNASSKEIFRILKDKGTFLIITPNPSSYVEWEKFFVDYDKDKKRIAGSVNIPGVIMNKNIIYTHSLEEIKVSFEQNGLKINSVDEFGDFGQGNLFIAIEGKK